jgi:hypothetical protein
VTADIAPIPDTTRSADSLNEALRALALTYIGARRAGGELRTRLLAIEQERAQLLGAIGEHEYGSASDRELAEIDRVRRMIARSSAASTERLRALEAVIAAVAGNVLTRSVTQAPAAAFPQPARSEPRPFAEVRPDAAVRGGWSPPSDAVVASRDPGRGRRLR